MIKFNTISIESFKAIDKVTIDLLPGIIKVTGNNCDDPYDSNGSGKTTAVQAISFALFNKDFNGAPLGSLGNRTLGTQPVVSVSFTNTTTGKHYLVLNDKQNKVHSLTEILPDGLGKAIVGVSEVQKEINRVLGMTYTTFKLTHFITSSTINSIADNLSQPTIFNDLLQVVEYQRVEKDIADISKQLQTELAILNSELEEVVRNKDLLTLNAKFDSVVLAAELDSTLAELEVLNNNFNTINITATSKIKETEAIVTSSKKDILTITKALKEGQCSTCGSVLAEKETLALLESSLLKEKDNLEEASSRLNKLSDSFKLVKVKYNSSREELQAKVNELTSNIKVAEEIDRLSKTSVGVSVKSEEELEASITRLKTLIAFYTSARKEIKSGNIIAGLMDSFFSVVEARLLEYSTILNLGAFDVKLSADNLGMKITLTQQVKGKPLEVPIETLSNGEKTRLSLLVLISMLDAMKIVSDCETNYLVFDEASSSFDKSGVEELSMLFSHLKNLGQSCFLITHGTEMDKVSFDYELTMTKSLGKSTGTLVPL